METYTMEYITDITYGEVKALLRKGYKIRMQALFEGVFITVQKTDYIKQYDIVASNKAKMYTYDMELESIGVDHVEEYIYHYYGAEWADK
jgi:hypothetical protein